MGLAGTITRCGSLVGDLWAESSKLFGSWRTEPPAVTSTARFALMGFRAGSATGPVAGFCEALNALSKIHLPANILLMCVLAQKNLS